MVTVGPGLPGASGDLNLCDFAWMTELMEQAVRTRETIEILPGLYPAPRRTVDLGSSVVRGSWASVLDVASGRDAYRLGVGGRFEGVRFVGEEKPGDDPEQLAVALLLTQASGATVRDCFFEFDSRAHVGIHAADARRVVIEGNRFGNDEARPIGGAIHALDLSFSRISGNAFHNLVAGLALVDVIATVGEQHHNTIDRNRFEVVKLETGPALRLIGGRFCSLLGNSFGRILDPASPVVELLGDGSPGVNNLIADLEVHNAGQGTHALRIHRSHGNKITGALFSLCQGPQVVLEEAGGTVVEGCSFRSEGDRSGDHAIECVGDQKNQAFVDNTMRAVQAQWAGLVSGLSAGSIEKGTVST